MLEQPLTKALHEDIPIMRTRFRGRAVREFRRGRLSPPPPLRHLREQRWSLREGKIHPFAGSRLSRAIEQKLSQQKNRLYHSTLFCCLSFTAANRTSPLTLDFYVRLPSCLYKEQTLASIRVSFFVRCLLIRVFVVGFNCVITVLQPRADFLPLLAFPRTNDILVAYLWRRVIRVARSSTL